VRKPDAEKPGQIHVLPMDGGEAAVITSLDKGASNPAWSPDGQWLAFSSDQNPALDDPKPEKPKHEPARVVTRPVFRENDIGFYDFDHTQHVWVVAATGAGARPMRSPRVAHATSTYAWGEGSNSDQHPPRGGGAMPLAFSADGKALLAQAAREGSSMLVRVDLATGQERELTPRGRDLIAG